MRSTGSVDERSAGGGKATSDVESHSASGVGDDGAAALDAAGAATASPEEAQPAATVESAKSQRAQVGAAARKALSSMSIKPHELYAIEDALRRAAMEDEEGSEFGDEPSSPSTPRGGGESGGASPRGRQRRRRKSNPDARASAGASLRGRSSSGSDVLARSTSRPRSTSLEPSPTRLSRSSSLGDVKKRRPSWFSSADGDGEKAPVGPSERGLNRRRRSSLAEMVGLVMASNASPPVASLVHSQRSGLQRDRYGGHARRRTQQLKTDGTGVEHSPRSPRRSRSRAASARSSRATTPRQTSPASTPRSTPGTTPGTSPGGSPLSSPPLVRGSLFEHNSILSPPRMAALDNELDVALHLPGRMHDGAAVSPPPPIESEHLVSEARESDATKHRGPQRAKSRSDLHDSLFDAALSSASPAVAPSLSSGVATSLRERRFAAQLHQACDESGSPPLRVSPRLMEISTGGVSGSPPRLLSSLHTPQTPQPRRSSRTQLPSSPVAPRSPILITTPQRDRRNLLSKMTNGNFGEGKHRAALLAALRGKKAGGVSSDAATGAVMAAAETEEADGDAVGVVAGDDRRSRSRRPSLLAALRGEKADDASSDAAAGAVMAAAEAEEADGDAVSVTAGGDRRNLSRRPSLTVRVDSNEGTPEGSTPTQTLTPSGAGGRPALTDAEIAAFADGAIARAFAHTGGGSPPGRGPGPTPIRAPRVPHAPRGTRGRRSSLQAFVDAGDEGGGAAGVLSAMSRSVQAQIAHSGDTAKRHTRRQSLVYADGEQFLNSTTRGQEKFFEGAVQAESGVGASDGDVGAGAPTDSVDGGYDVNLSVLASAQRARRGAFLVLPLPVLLFLTLLPQLLAVNSICLWVPIGATTLVSQVAAISPLLWLPSIAKSGTSEERCCRDTSFAAHLLIRWHLSAVFVFLSLALNAAEFFSSYIGVTWAAQGLLLAYMTAFGDMLNKRTIIISMAIILGAYGLAVVPLFASVELNDRMVAFHLWQLAGGPFSSDYAADAPCFPDMCTKELRLGRCGVLCLMTIGVLLPTIIMQNEKDRLQHVVAKYEAQADALREVSPEEEKMAESILNNILPPEINKLLLDNPGRTIAHEFSHVSIMFGYIGGLQTLQMRAGEDLHGVELGMRTLTPLERLDVLSQVCAARHASHCARLRLPSSRQESRRSPAHLPSLALSSSHSFFIWPPSDSLASPPPPPSAPSTPSSSRGSMN